MTYVKKIIPLTQGLGGGENVGMGTSHIPSLEPRDPLPRPSRGRMGLLTFLLTWGFIRSILRTLDWFGEGESAVDIYNLLPHFFQFLGSPIFSFVAIVFGFSGLIWQARHDEDSRPIPATQLIHGITKRPIRSRRRVWPIIKLPVFAVLVAIIVALPVWACYKTQLRSFIFVDKLPLASLNDPIPPDIVYAPKPPLKPSKPLEPTLVPVPSTHPPTSPPTVAAQPAQVAPAVKPALVPPAQPSGIAPSHGGNSPYYEVTQALEAIGRLDERCKGIAENLRQSQLPHPIPTVRIPGAPPKVVPVAPPPKVDMEPFYNQENDLISQYVRLNLEEMNKNALAYMRHCCPAIS